MLLGAHIPEAPNLGWWLGLGIGFAIVVVVVAVVAALLLYATRINDQLQEALKAAEGAREGTAPLSSAEGAGEVAAGLLEAATEARRQLEESVARLEAAAANESDAVAGVAHEAPAAEPPTVDDRAPPDVEREPPRAPAEHAAPRPGGALASTRGAPSRRGALDRLRRLVWRRSR